MKNLEASKKQLIFIAGLVTYSLILIFLTYKITVHQDMKSIKQQSNTSTEKNKKTNEQKKIEKDVIIKVIGKYEVIGKVSNNTTFKLSVTNNTDTDIKGIQGNLTIKDIFGKEIKGLKGLQCDLTGKIIEAGASVEFKDIHGIDTIFEEIWPHVYYATFDDLTFDYTITAIVFTDGTKEEY